MKKQDYIEEVRSDVEEYLECYINEGDSFNDVDLDDLINTCSGNYNGSYTFNRCIAEENITGCPELVVEALTYYDCSVGEIEEAEYIDVIIRLFILENEIDLEEIFNDMLKNAINEDIEAYFRGEDGIEKKFVYYPEEFKKAADGPSGFAGLYGIISEETEEMLKNSIEYFENYAKSCDYLISEIEDSYNSGKYDGEECDRLIGNATRDKKGYLEELEKYKRLKALIIHREYPDECDDCDQIQEEIRKIKGVI